MSVRSIVSIVLGDDAALSDIGDFGGSEHVRFTPLMVLGFSGRRGLLGGGSRTFAPCSR